MYLIIGEVDGHIEEKNWSKYLVFDSTDKNKEVLEKYTELWHGIKNKIDITNGGKTIEYGKYFMKIKFDSNWRFTVKQTIKISNSDNSCYICFGRTW